MIQSDSEMRQQNAFHCILSQYPFFYENLIFTLGQIQQFLDIFIHSN